MELAAVIVKGCYSHYRLWFKTIFITQLTSCWQCLHHLSKGKLECLPPRPLHTRKVWAKCSYKLFIHVAAKISGGRCLEWFEEHGNNQFELAIISLWKPLAWEVNITSSYSSWDRPRAGKNVQALPPSLYIKSIAGQFRQSPKVSTDRKHSIYLDDTRWSQAIDPLLGNLTPEEFLRH